LCAEREKERAHKPSAISNGIRIEEGKGRPQLPPRRGGRQRTLKRKKKHSKKRESKRSQTLEIQGQAYHSDDLGRKGGHLPSGNGNKERIHWGRKGRCHPGEGKRGTPPVIREREKQTPTGDRGSKKKSVAEYRRNNKQGRASFRHQMGPRWKTLKGSRISDRHLLREIGPGRGSKRENLILMTKLGARLRMACA